MFHASTVANLRGLGLVVTVIPFGSGSIPLVGTVGNTNVDGPTERLKTGVTAAVEGMLCVAKIGRLSVKSTPDMVPKLPIAKLRP